MKNSNHEIKIYSLAILSFRVKMCPVKSAKSIFHEDDIWQAASDELMCVCVFHIDRMLRSAGKNKDLPEYQHL
jgi:hypothetical protein